MTQRISRFALQQRSRIEADDDAEGVRRLMWALLKDTLRTYHAHACDDSVEGMRRFREAEQWFTSDDVSWLFSFESVCAVLGIDADYLRSALRRWRRAALARARRERGRGNGAAG